MKKTFAFLTILALAATPAFAAKATVDYDESADFTNYETFQYVETAESSIEQSNSLMHGRIVSIVEKTLTDAGLKMVDSDPDLFVTYHAQMQEGSTFHTTGFGYGGGGRYRRYGGFGGGSSSTMETKYTEGTLLVDAWDAKTEKLVWRGTSSQVLKSKPDKQAKQVEKALGQMAKAWEKILKGMGK